MRTIKARFVGGPRHNEVIECDRLPCIRVAKPVEFNYWAVSATMTLETESYLLCRFVSEGGAPFTQYVHESLMRGGEPARESYDVPDAPALPSRMFDAFITELIVACLRARR